MTQAPVAEPITPEWMAKRPTTSENRNINPIYWKRSPNYGSPGDIIIGPGLETAQAASWKRRGRIPLEEYSLTDRVSPKTLKRETIDYSADQLMTPWRYYWLFKNQWAHLFPIEQIVEHHWHIEPPYGLPLSVFPQLEEYDVPEPYWCAACPGRRPPLNSEEQLITHAMIHHRMTLPEARDLLRFAKERAQSTGAALAIRRRAKAVEAERAKRDEQPAIQEPEAKPPKKPARPAMCVCGTEFPNGFARMWHVRRGECPNASVSASEET